MITIVTATYNVKDTIPKLIESLQKQSDQNFKWIVVDNQSDDGTVDILKAVASSLPLTIISEKDFGIYDALNKALPLIETDYYLVIGADDTLYSDAVAQYNGQAKRNEAHLVVAPIHIGDYLKQPPQQWSWAAGLYSVISNHSVGTLIKKSLHTQYGNYSNRFPIAADMLFLLKAYRGGAKIVWVDSPAGQFNLSGVSSRYTLQSIMESTQIRIENGGRFEIEILYMLLRLARHYRVIRYNLKRCKTN